MNKSILSSAGVAAMALAMVAMWPAVASAQVYGADTPIYGGQLMTEQERLEYRERMRNAETADERERLRIEHAEQVQERARERGVTLPPDRPGMGQGMGQGMGSGMGPANGAEPGGPGNGMEERYREERQEQRHERMMEPDEYRRGSGMGGGGGRN